MLYSILSISLWSEKSAGWISGFRGIRGIPGGIPGKFPGNSGEIPGNSGVFGGGPKRAQKGPFWGPEIPDFGGDFGGNPGISALSWG